MLDDDRKRLGGPEILVAAPAVQPGEEWLPTLRKHGFSCHGVEIVAELCRALESGRFGMVILDDDLPGGDGLAAVGDCSGPNRPGLIFVGRDPFGECRARALGNRADIFLSHPLEPGVLVLAVRNLVERIRLSQEWSWTLDLLRWQLVAPNGRALRLSLKERLLVEALFRCPGSAVTRETIAGLITAHPRTQDARGLEIMVRRLRRKMAEVFHLDPPLLTLHGVGYVFSAPARVLGEQAVDGRAGLRPPESGGTA